MTFLKSTLPVFILALSLSACQPAAGDSSAAEAPEASKASASETSSKSASAEVETIVWEDLMPEGEDQLLAELYTEFYEEQEEQFRQQLTLSQAAKAEGDLMTMVEEGSAQDTMEQVGTYNVVDELDGTKIRMPGYVVPLDFNADSEYDQFLLVPYFGACLHTPPPPPNQIVFVKSSPATKVANIYEPVWVEGLMRTGKFGSELGNSAYQLTLSKLEPYEY